MVLLNLGKYHGTFPGRWAQEPQERLDFLKTYPYFYPNRKGALVLEHLPHLPTLQQQEIRILRILHAVLCQQQRCWQHAAKTSPSSPGITLKSTDRVRCCFNLIGAVMRFQCGTTSYGIGKMRQVSYWFSSLWFLMILWNDFWYYA